MMPRTGNSRPFVFIHLWKTGGTSLHSFFRAVLPGYQLVEAGARTRAGGWLHGSPHIGGHFLWEQVDDLTFGRATTAVVLRDPVERTLSQFAFNRRHGGDFAHHLKVQSSLESALRRVIDRGANEQLCLLSNLQTGVLAGPARGSADPRERLGAAKEHLARVTHVGLTERLAEFGATVAAGVGRMQAPVVPFENRTGERPTGQDLSPETRTLLLEANRLDQELYHFAAGRPHVAGGASIAGDHPKPQAGGSAINSYGNGSCRFESVAAEISPDGLIIRSRLHAVEAGHYNAGFLLVDALGVALCGTNTAALGADLQLQAGDRREVQFTVPVSLAAGRYVIFSEVADEFSVCHRPLAGVEVNLGSAACPGVGLLRPRVLLR